MDGRLLFADEFTNADQLEMADLHCGEEPWSRAASEWIKGSDVFDSIESQNTSVWVFRDHVDAIVGFASLNATGWKRWPPPDGNAFKPAPTFSAGTNPHSELPLAVRSIPTRPTSDRQAAIWIASRFHFREVLP